MKTPGKTDQFTSTMASFKEEQNRLLPKFVEKIQNMETEVFDMFRTIQFGYIDLANNKAFASLIEDKSPVSNPKAMVYISGQNKV